MNAPTKAKDNITIFLSHANYIGKGRLAFLFKDKWKKGMDRKKVKQYQTNFGVLYQSNTNLSFRKSSLRKEESRNESQEVNERQWWSYLNECW